jgi:hypothetical protein
MKLKMKELQINFAIIHALEMKAVALMSRNSLSFLKIYGSIP